MQIKDVREKTDFEKWIEDINYNLNFIFEKQSPVFRQKLQNLGDFEVDYSEQCIRFVEVYHKRYVEAYFGESAYNAAIMFYGFAAQIYHENNKEGNILK